MISGASLLQVSIFEMNVQFALIQDWSSLVSLWDQE